MSVWTVPNYSDDWAVPGYTEERQVGRGASGRVVAAVNNQTSQRVAIKYLGAALVRDPAFMWEFRTEAELMRTLDVPQVVRIYDYVEQPGQGAAIVMELIDGVSLHEMIAHNGPTSPEAALAVLKGSLLGLAAAHTIGIVHRDYKPENVLVDTNGNSKLSDFGVAIKAGKQMPMAGTPLYMAPEQWQGAPSSPATDIYAATAVFFECLTGQTPFSGKLGHLRDQHIAAPVPIDQVDAPLHGLIARGMAKNPATRPQTAITFVAELESAAAAAYGPGWEERGRRQLAERAVALLPLLIRNSKPGSRGTSVAATWLGDRRGKVLGIAAITTAALVAVAAVATAVTLSGNSSNQTNLNTESEAATTLATFTSQAAVTPPVTVSDCAAPSTFTYTGTLTASSAGTMSYQWVYSSGKPGPVETVHFAAAGHQQVTGETVTAQSASSGWGEIKVASPAPQTSNRASYQLLCSTSAGGISPAASVEPSTKTVACGTTPPPSFSAAGSITTEKAETVSYHWALADGQSSPTQTLTFSGPSTQAVAPLTITPPGDTTSGEAILVVTSPVAAVSRPATYSLSCTGATTPKATAVAAVSPATETVASCTGTAPAFTFSGSITAAMAGTVSYHWQLPNGSGPTQTLQFTAAGTKAVTAATYTPATDTASGSGSIVVTSQGGVASNAAAFTLTCGTGLSISTSGAATATTGTAYSATATATGGNGTFKWATVTGLPTGLTATANAGTLTIAGTPTQAGTFAVKLSVSDTSSPAKTATSTLSLTVSAPALSVTTSSLAAGTSGTAYSATVTASGGSGTDTWSATGLPAGLAMSATGTISGTPTATGTYSVTVTVTDTASPAQTAMATLSLTVSAPALSITTSSLGNGIVGTAYTATVAATGGAGTDTWSATGLPAGLAMSAAGTISGTPTASGTFSVAVTVSDTASPVQTASATFSVSIIAAAVVTPSTPASSASTSASASTSTTARASSSSTVSVSVSPSAAPSPTVIIE